jgi:hypothetical protein
MRTIHTDDVPRGLPKPVLEICVHLEERGIRTLSHGEGLLDDLSQPRSTTAGEDPAEAHGLRHGTRSLLCAADSETVLRALPRAVVTGEAAGRLTQATRSGPIDLVFTGESSPEQALLNFGLGPFGFAFRPANESWCDPADQRRAFSEGRIELTTQHPNPFAVAPRRYWIAARLMAEHGLEAAPSLVSAARDAFPKIETRLPQAAPARREISRILAAENPGPALTFLRESGVSGLLVPGTQAENEARIGHLPPLAAVRWAAWLRGSATASSLVRFRVPHALARRVERLQGSHPLERSVEVARDLGIRKLLQRHGGEEIESLLAWRRLELATGANSTENDEVEARLGSIEERIAAVRTANAQAGQVQALALDGSAVMAVLGAGPGRHVGKALSHLARFVAEQPNTNEPSILEAELRAWAVENTNLID